MKLVMSAAFVLQYSALAHTLFQNNIYDFHEIKMTEGFLNHPDFWSACSYHFNSTRILTVLVAPFSDTVCHDTVSNMIIIMHSRMNIPVILIEEEEEEEEEDGQLEYSLSVEPQSITTDVREYPAKSAHSYMIITYNILNALSYTTDKKRPQNEWTPKDNILILIILHKSWYSCAKQQILEYVNILKNMWTEHKILNVIAIVKHLDSCKK